VATAKLPATRLETLVPVDAADSIERARRLVRHALRVRVAHVHLTPAAVSVPGPGEELSTRVEAVLERLCTRVLATAGPVALTDSDREVSPKVNGAAEPTAFLGVPIFGWEEEPIGCLCVADSAPRQWTPKEAALLTDVAALLARQLAPAMGTEEVRTLENLVRMLGKAVENMQLGVTITDMSGLIVYTNTAEAGMHGYGVSELVGTHASVLGPPEQTRVLDSEGLRETTSWTRETVNIRKDGTRFPVLLWSDLVTDANGNGIGVVTCCEDITERKRAEQALRDVALRDPLTGLPNRVYFLDRLNHAIQALQQDSQRGFAVLFLDLDRFKVVNDSLGHHVGDRLLAIIARRLQACLRPADTIARFGGDEFAVLVESVSELEGATMVAERIQAELAEPLHLDGYELFTSASIGIVLGSHAMEQPEYLWRGADMAMYRAKAMGTGRFEVFDRAMHAHALTRLQLETDLRRAVERNEFRLFYQPVIDLEHGSIVGFEALLRWEHPLRGLVMPQEVIPLAEETGLILAIGAWVVDEACRQLAAWQAEGGAVSDLWVSVNLSGKQLTQADLVERVAAAIRDSGIQPHSLKMEITESAVVENTDQAADTLLALKALGVQLLMDDFGTGYSSLSYLHRLPLDALKIDRSFVSRMKPGDQHLRLVETIVNLAHSVRLHVVGEGVSTADQLAILRELGCELAQGFYFAQPLPLEEARALLATGKRW
jgi:diguanylate cyclase (GGDEF)-like protein/PAS domain S-box-containing protein